VNFLPILRNNSYTVTVSSVAVSGFPTEEEAFNSIPVNIETNVPVWNNNDISTTITDGVYMLGMSQKVV
jgi:hypothetical protein